MRIQVFENQSMQHRFRSYVKGDPLLLSWDGYISPDDGDTEALLEEIFVHFNLDARPNGKIRSSLSVGDVITIEGGPRRLCESYAVERGGFTKLLTPCIASRTEKLNLVEEMRKAGVRPTPRLSRLLPNSKRS